MAISLLPLHFEGTYLRASVGTFLTVSIETQHPTMLRKLLLILVIKFLLYEHEREFLLKFLTILLTIEELDKHGGRKEKDKTKQ